MIAIDRTLGRGCFITKLFLAMILLVFQGCSTTNNHAVLAVTGTSIGLEISQNPSTQSPQGKLGYNRSEFAYVPTNRPNTKEIMEGTKEKMTPPMKVEGADQSTNVLMELKYAGIFSWGDGGGIYQRLAVGKEAVTQPGAALMFARDAAGDMSDATAGAAAQAFKNVKKIEARDDETKPKVEAISGCYAKNRSDPTKGPDILSAIKKHYKDFDEFTDAATKHDRSKLDAIMKDSKVKGICKFK